MTFLRRLLLPAIIAAPLWSWLGRVPWQGWGSLREPLDLGLWGWAVGAFFSLAGLLVIGLPTGQLLIRRRMAPFQACPLLLVLGGLGGMLFGGLISALVAAMTTSPLDSVGGAFLVGGWFGAVPGATVALVWGLINYDLFKPRARELNTDG